MDIAKQIASHGNVFVFQADIHYQAYSKLGTATKGPPFD